MVYCQGSSMTRYLLMPFHLVSLILVAVFTVVGSYSIAGKIFGIPADVILVSWFFKYLYVLLDSVVAGHEELPVLSVEMLNPVDEQRPLYQAIMVALGFIASWWVYHSVAPAAGITLGVVFLIALPATVALLAISDSWVHAISPVAIGRVIKGLRLNYVGAVLVTLGGALAIFILALNLDSLLLILALAQLVLLAMFSFIGGAIFESRVELQLDTRTQGERLAEREDRHHADARGAVLDRTYALLRLKRRSEAWTHLQTWMKQHCPDSHPFTEYHALQEATCSWDEPIIGDQVTHEYLGRLLAKGETGMALEALQIRLNTNPGYYPLGQAYAKRLTELVRLSGRKAISRQLLANAPPAAQ
jgi:hypothetical protein